MATGHGHAVSINYGIRYSDNTYQQYGVHRSYFFQTGSGWWKDSISEQDAYAAGGDELYISASGDQETTITTRIMHLDKSGNETALAENTATSSCESAYMFAFSGGGRMPPQKVICRELHRQGLMDETIFEADEAFGRYLRENHNDVLQGYRFWAKPVASLMQKSPLFTQIVDVLATPWSYEMAYRMGARDKGSFAGRLLMDIGMPVCGAIGKAKIWAESVPH